MTYYMNVDTYANSSDDEFMGKLQQILKVSDETSGHIHASIVQYIADTIPNRKIWIHGMLVNGLELIFQFSLTKGSKAPTGSFSFTYRDDTFTEIMDFLDYSLDLHKDVNTMKRQIQIKQIEENNEKLLLEIQSQTFSKKKTTAHQTGTHIASLINPKTIVKPKRKKKSCKK